MIKPIKTFFALIIFIFLNYFDIVVFKKNFFLTPIKATESKEKINLPKYILGPGDTLSIKVYQLPEFNAQVKLLPDGYVNLPRLDSFSLNGLTLPEAKILITNEYSKILKNPLVYIDLIKSRPIMINVLGEIQRPGIYSLSINETNEISNTDGGEAIINKNYGWPTVVDAIQKSGGLKTSANIRNVTLKRYDKVKNEFEEIIIDFWDILTQFNLGQNYRIFDGDSIIVSKSDKINSEQRVFISQSNLGPSNITVTVIGEVIRPGKQNISANSPVLMGIMNSGGFTNKAKKTNVTVLRLDGNAISKTKFNLSKNKTNEDKYYLKDGDVIFVDKNNLAKTSDNLQIVTEPLQPVISAASFYRLLFEN